MNMNRELLFVSIRKNIQSAGFYDEACYRYYLTRILNCSSSFEVSLHAYALFENEVLMLCTPMSLIEQKLFLKFLNASYSEYFNARFERTGKVWSNGYRIRRLEARSAMVFQKYIESEAVSRGITKHPGAYEWSSYCSNCFNRKPAFLTPHDQRRKLFTDHTNPYEEYRRLFAQPFDQADIVLLKERGNPLGM